MTVKVTADKGGAHALFFLEGFTEMSPRSLGRTHSYHTAGRTGRTAGRIVGCSGNTAGTAAQGTTRRRGPEITAK